MPVGRGALLLRPVAKEAEEGVKESFCSVALLPVHEAGSVLLTHPWWNETVGCDHVQHQVAQEKVLSCMSTEYLLMRKTVFQ